MAAMMSVTSACSARPTSGVAARRSGFSGNVTAFNSRVVSGNRAGERGSLVVQMAASREKKSRDLSMLKGMLDKEETLLVAGFRYEGLSVRVRVDPPAFSCRQRPRVFLTLGRTLTRRAPTSPARPRHSSLKPSPVSTLNR